MLPKVLQGVRDAADSQLVSGIEFIQGTNGELVTRVGCDVGRIDRDVSGKKRSPYDFG